MRLSAFAQSTTQLEQCRVLANEGLVVHIVKELDLRYALLQLTRGPGMSFTAEIGDNRMSLSYRLNSTLIPVPGSGVIADPFVTIAFEAIAFDELVERGELVIHCTPIRSIESSILAASRSWISWESLVKANATVQGSLCKN